MKMIKSIAILFFIILSKQLFAQSGKPISISDKIQQQNNTFPIEKLYLSFDKPYYNVGDTIWYKSILLNGDLNQSTRTDKIYIELFNDSSKFMESRVTLLNNGLGYGDFALKKELKEGTYTIRAYSNWQQNFGETYFFQKSFYVGNAGDKTWLLDSYQKLSTIEGKSVLDLKLRLSTLNNEAAGLKDVEVYLLNGNKRIMRAELQTTIDGKIETSIPLQDDRIGKYSFHIVDKRDRSRKLILPIILQDVTNVDLQFLPEGGHMVNGVFGKVAFKAIGADGLGKTIRGFIINNKNDTLANFSASPKGMGNFHLLPVKGEQYYAVYKLDKKEQQQALPIAFDEGTAVRIDHLSKKDSILVYVRASEAKRTTASYRLLAQAAGEIVFDAALNLQNGFSNLKLAKKDFPDGIIHFTLFSPDQLAVNERQVFINRNQKIDLQVNPSHSTYGKRDSIAIELNAKKEDGSPLLGTFSVSVTADNQVKLNPNEDNIISYFLLQSNLKGNIEDAGWYFNNDEPSTLTALDNLLLTQAWVGYQWNQLSKLDTIPLFKTEKGNIIEGKLTNLFNKPVPNISLTLMALGKTIFVTDTTSNVEGKFIFKDLPLLDSAAYSIKIKNAKGKTSSATITVDEFNRAADPTSFNTIQPWYINTDSTTLNYYKSKATQNKREALITANKDVNQLKEVEIKGKLKLQQFAQQTAWDSKFLLSIDEEELKANSKKTLLELLNERIKGFRKGFSWTDVCGKRVIQHKFENYIIGNSLISHVMIDNINTHMVASGIDDTYNGTGMSNTASDSAIMSTNEYIFSTLKATDIVNITLYEGCSYYFLDITTRSGKGPWIVRSPGMYVYRPLPFYNPKDFYSPKYSVNKNVSVDDTRSTIFWDANVATDESGKAKISFYAGDHSGNYTIRIEGTDLSGRFGYQKSSLKIINKTESK